MQQITSCDLGSSQMKSASRGESESSQLALKSFQKLFHQAQSPERGHHWHRQRQAGYDSPKVVCDLLVGLLSTGQLWLQKHTQVLEVLLCFHHLTKKAQ